MYIVVPINVAAPLIFFLLPFLLITAASTIMPKPDFRHMMWALLAKLQTEGRGNEFYYVLKNKLLYVLEINLNIIAKYHMAASELRWEVYREMTNHFWEESIPKGANLFLHADNDTPLPEDCPAFDIYSMEEAITTQTAEEELIDILWKNGTHQQERAVVMIKRDDTSQFSTDNAFLSIAEHLINLDMAKEREIESKRPKGASGHIKKEERSDEGKRKGKLAYEQRRKKRYAKRRARKARKAQIKVEEGI
ncbi:hypothetical protein F5X96DRAFT_610484 [Biscogniauxia mediterranea]|nr:hypothetical protein F5X96DRAFT_610484 [Biscogniauxia mediterranea]